MLQHSVSNKNAAANSQIKPLSLVPFCCVHTLAVVILEPLSTTDESTLFRTMAPPCNVCCPLPTSVAPSSSSTRSQSDGAQVTIGACGINEATCVGRWPGRREAEMHSPLGCLACFGRSNCTAAARSNNSPTAFSALLGRNHTSLPTVPARRLPVTLLPIG